MTTAGALWDATEVFERRHEKSARVLLALERTLSRERPLGGDESEFCELAASLRDLDPELFTQVWTDPSAYRWARLGFHLLAAVLRGEEPAPETRGVCESFGTARADEALRRHLGEFKRFVLALDHLGGNARKLATPLQVELPFALPGTPFFVEGEGRAELWSAAELPLRECPVVQVAGCRIRLQPEAFQLPGLRFGPTLLESGAAYQRRSQPWLEAAIGQVARHLPACLRQLRHVVQVVALKPLEAGDFTNTSCSDLPGAFVVGVIEHPQELADSLIHEFHHDRLFTLEEQGPFFESAEAGVRSEAYYSPWRPDLRSLQGILHAVYVHQPVWRFWRNVLEEAPGDEPLAGYARDRLLRTALQLAIGVDQLARHARWTGFGGRLFGELRRGAGGILAEVASVLGGRDVPAWVCSPEGSIRGETAPGEARQLGVRESVAQHVWRYAPEDQAADAVAAAGVA